MLISACYVAPAQVRGIGGKEIADGSAPKLALAILWQLMRAHVYHFLDQLGVGESGILEWANARVQASGSGIPQLMSFSDPWLANSTFVLRLLHAVAPECVSLDEMVLGASRGEHKLNAVYAISCAHKMGCTIFATWEDLVEARSSPVLPFAWCGSRLSA